MKKKKLNDLIIKKLIWKYNSRWVFSDFLDTFPRSILKL
jgi:hypothetical protein